MGLATVLSAIEREQECNPGATWWRQRQPWPKFLKDLTGMVTAPQQIPTWIIYPGLVCERKINFCGVYAIPFGPILSGLAYPNKASTVEYQQFYFLKKSVCVYKYFYKSGKTYIKTYLYVNPTVAGSGRLFILTAVQCFIVNMPQFIDPLLTGISGQFPVSAIIIKPYHEEFCTCLLVHTHSYLLGTFLQEDLLGHMLIYSAIVDATKLYS